MPLGYICSEKIIRSKVNGAFELPCLGLLYTVCVLNSAYAIKTACIQRVRGYITSDQVRYIDLHFTYFLT